MSCAASLENTAGFYEYYRYVEKISSCEKCIVKLTQEEQNQLKTKSKAQIQYWRTTKKIAEVTGVTLYLRVEVSMGSGMRKALGCTRESKPIMTGRPMHYSRAIRQLVKRLECFQN